MYDIALELSKRLKTQHQLEELAAAWKPYMKNLDTLYTDAICYESAIRYPTDAKLLWVTQPMQSCCGNV